MILRENIEDEIHFNSTIANIQQSKSGSIVTFNSATLEKEEYAAVVGADGLHSQVRQLAFGDISLKDMGVTCWRWTCDYPIENLQPTFQLGKQDIFLTYPIGKQSVYCYKQSFDSENKLSHQPDYQTQLKNIFSKYGGLVPTMLDRLPDNSTIIPGRLRSVPKPLFTQGNFALVGDASNACSPMLQQGAACAFEDVIVLSELLAKFSAQEALTHYMNYRQERINWIIQASDGPMKTISKMNSFSSLFARDMLIRWKGPFNIQGWSKLLASDPIAELPAYILDAR